jgi:hypothetical protein
MSWFELASDDIEEKLTRWEEAKDEEIDNLIEGWGVSCPPGVRPPPIQVASEFRDILGAQSHLSRNMIDAFCRQLMPSASATVEYREGKGFIFPDLDPLSLTKIAINVHVPAHAYRWVHAAVEFYPEGGGKPAGTLLLRDPWKNLQPMDKEIYEGIITSLKDWLVQSTGSDDWMCVLREGVENPALDWVGDTEN